MGRLPDCPDCGTRLQYPKERTQVDNKDRVLSIKDEIMFRFEDDESNIIDEKNGSPVFCRNCRMMIVDKQKEKED